MMQTSNLGLDFLNRTLRTAGIVLLIFFPFGFYYLGFYPALAVFSGGVWGMVNFIFLSAFIRTVAVIGEVDKMRTAVLALIKFPLLYLAGYGLLLVPQFGMYHLVAGFSILLAVMMLKAASRVLLNLDGHDANGNHAQESV
ncbi:MAG: hypothetical protein OEV49_04880 [candidate division Zixibacteria bacterium]|nr:hypothetical protein [candidate division Zixibacteria bacterium]MDH3937243.1 hypothetical protein [candidate division Zixibacteria bacterium]MDH4033969.1 hypothetical protein [candidate division Zixibacteria bacterium]